MNTFFKVLIILFLPLSLGAQTSNVQKSYLNGKDLFNSGRYALAIEAFKPLTTYSNTFSEYATFFYALSAYHDGQIDIAKNIFLQLARKYPSWTKKHEADFWLGKIYFEKASYEQAVGALIGIRDRSLSDPVKALTLEYLPKADLKVLKDLHSKYPNNSEVAQSLATKLALPPLLPGDQDLFETLLRKFNFDRDEISNMVVGPTVMKDSYRVAVCFPFMTNDIKRDHKFNANQWVLDMYQGILLGERKLQSDNISLEIFAYDTERDSIKTAQILANDEMQTMDLVIGPLYPQPSELVANFTYDHGINTLNPLSNNLQIISNNPYSFLFNPGNETRALAAAEFMADKIDENKKALIIYGSRNGDSIAAFTYREVLVSKDIEVIMMDRVPTADSEEIARFISDHLITVLGDGDRPAKENIGHVYVAATDELVVANVIGTIDNIGPELNIMGDEGWLNSRYVDFKQLERMQVYLMAPNYVDYSSDNFKEFQKNYKRTTGSIPNRFSYIGYDLIQLFGKLLHQGGTYFQHDLQTQDFYAGTLFQGYNYQGHNDNQTVPIVTFQDGLLTLVNK